MANENILNPKTIAEFLKEKMEHEILVEAEPLIQKALQDIERVMRRKLASMIIAQLDHEFSVQRMGESLIITVRYEH